MRKKRAKPHVNHERWLVSYADFITLMFAFFVVMYSTSKADLKKQAQVAVSIDSAFHNMGLFPQNSAKNSAKAAQMQDASAQPINIVLADDLVAPQAVKEDLDKLKDRLNGMLHDQIEEHIVTTRIGRDGLVISLREAGFYDSGSAIVHPSSLPTLHKIANSLSSATYDIRIEGHTDNVPIHTGAFDSNWELSTTRATQLIRIFVADGLASYRLSASGYAEFHPVAPNESAEGRAQNRRVDIIVLPRSSVPPATTHSEPSAAKATGPSH